MDNFNSRSCIANVNRKIIPVNSGSSFDGNALQIVALRLMSRWTALSPNSPFTLGNVLGDGARVVLVMDAFAIAWGCSAAA